MEPSLVQQRQSLRQHIRRLRCSLSEPQQFAAGQQLAEHAILFSPIQQAQHIALFMSMDGEINTRPLIARLWHLGKSVYLPRINPHQPTTLLFQRFTPQTTLVKHRFGMMEPEENCDECRPFTDLDVVIVPLVAFDSDGQRLGMGGGFYDRLLVNWQEAGVLPIGVAHNCQHQDTLPIQPWDIPLPAVITPNKLWQWGNKEA
ncbi:5-formyltetrahydrofolate cyclo-ligase [Rosenbergiella australiborealis]|uniref:5-formyltetrahydrofolate cyclo-ligase n=1 Tax=Rosenbergiella australiborealis TaxID=1544696 RepID=A0ABS5T826_9GAMM|nr:5-formyltetrahydrofolate cyclo-ligase [Rosenbergiella australiborealis]MBT0727863.1 5-formyltetrahydrofolate cyclo-ligase [Rosenbergiella australiborealis]